MVKEPRHCRISCDFDAWMRAGLCSSQRRLPHVEAACTVAQPRLCDDFACPSMWVFRQGDDPSHALCCFYLRKFLSRLAVRNKNQDLELDLLTVLQNMMPSMPARCVPRWALQAAQALTRRLHPRRQLRPRLPPPRSSRRAQRRTAGIPPSTPWWPPRGCAGPRPGERA